MRIVKNRYFIGSQEVSQYEFEYLLRHLQSFIQKKEGELHNFWVKENYFYNSEREFELHHYIECNSLLFRALYVDRLKDIVNEVL